MYLLRFWSSQQLDNGKRVAAFFSLLFSQSYTTTASVYSSFELSLRSQNSLFPSKSHYYSHFDMYSATSFMEKWFAKCEFKCEHTKSADAPQSNRRKNPNGISSFYMSPVVFLPSFPFVSLIYSAFHISTFPHNMTICVCSIKCYLARFNSCLKLFMKMRQNVQCTAMNSISLESACCSSWRKVLSTEAKEKCLLNKYEGGIDMAIEMN